MKKNFKRWLALLLAVIMIASTGLSHADGFLKATEGDVTEATEGTEELVVTDDTVEEEQEEPVEDVQILEVPKNPEEVTEESQEPEASQPTETPETPQAPEAQEEPVETPEEITYQVVFNEPKLAGGTISVWAEGEEKQAVSYGTARELKEGAVLHFTVAASENFEIEQVMANDAALSAVSGEQKSAEYEVTAAADTQITVVYKDVTPVEDKAEEAEDIVKGTMPASDVAVTFHYTSAGKLQPVYIYVQITGKIPEGATLNKDGWYTVGMSQLYIPCKPEDKGHGYDLIAKGDYQLEDAKAALDVPPFEDFNENDGILANEIKEKGKKFELKAVSSGATDYLGNGYCWHLDIQVNYEDIQDKFVNVIYTDGVENATVFEDKVFAGIEGTNTPGYGADPSRPGYTFAGWSPKVADVLRKPENDNSIVYTATWTANEAKIVFEENGGSDVSDMKGTTDQTISATTMPTTTREGYEFKGWYDNASFTGAQVTSLSTKYPAGKTTYYAKWEAKAAKIVFEENGGTQVEDLSGVTDKEIENRTMPTTTRNGYEFLGWYADKEFTGNAVETLPEKFPSVETTYYAKWSDAVSYNITYNLDGGSVTEKNPTTYTVETESFTLNNPTKEGYQFDGWTGTGLTEKTQTVTIQKGSTGDRAYTAHWSPRNDLSYRVEYYYDGIKDDSETVIFDNQTFGATINTYNDKKITGYEFDKTENLPLTIGVNEEENVIKVYYKKVSNLTYTVNYLDKETNQPIDTAKVVENQIFGTKVTAESEKKDIDGYTYDSAASDDIIIGMNADENVINLYYNKRTDLSYTVNYYEEGTTNPVQDSVVVENVAFGTEITAAEKAMTIAGYNYKRADKDKIIVGTGENVLNLYYEKKTDLSYTVKYLEAGTGKELETAKTVNNCTFGKTYSEKAVTIKGYNVVGNAEQSITVADGENILTFSYTKKSDLGYVVNYLEKNEDGTTTSIQDQKSVGGKTYGDVIDVATEVIEINGYNYQDAAPEKELVIDDSSENVINLYYEKRSDLSYTVNYLEEGTDQVLSAPAKVEKQTFGTVVTAESYRIPITGYESAGADKESIKVGTEEDQNVINLYYKKRTDLSYTVEYYYDGKIDASKTETKYKQTFEAVIETYEDKVIAGYELDREEGLPLKIGVDATANVIRVYYKPVSNLTYTVNYLEKGVEGNEDTVLAPAKKVTGQTFGTVIDAETEIAEAPEIDGYNYPPVVLVANITIGTGENVLNLYYTRRSDLTYTVNYLEFGTDKVLAEPETVDGQVFGTEINGRAVGEEAKIPGYKFNYADPSILVVQTDSSRNVLNLYYSKRTDMTYTVRYLEVAEEGQEPKELYPEKTEEKCTLGETYTEYGKRISGYKCDALETGNKKSITISANEEENVLTFWYTKRNDLTYKVQYIDQSTGYKIGPKEKEYTATFKEEIFSENVKIDISGYKYVGADKDKIIISTTTKNNLIKLFYEKRTDLSFTVEHYKIDFNEETQQNEFEFVATETYEKQTFGTSIKAKDYKKTDIKGYEYGYAEVDGERVTRFTLRADSSKNVIKLYYKKGYYPYGWTQRDIDVPGSVLGSGGVWQGALYGSEISSEKLMKDNNVADIPGYKFVQANPDPLVIDAVDHFSAKTENHMDLYYQRRSDMTYTVEYFYDGVRADDQTVNGKDGVYKDEIPYTANATTTYNDKNYMLKEVLKTGDGTVTLDPAMNIVRVYYVLDDNGPNGGPDEIPDSEEYRVFYDPNGGEGTVADNAIYPKDYVVTAKENAFTKADSVFAIWEKDGADKVAAGETFVMPERDVTLEAQWKMLTVHKKASAPADGISYKLDEVINFTIDVTNNGDVDLANVEVTDELEGAVIGAGEGYVVSGNVAQIANLSVGSTVTVKATYTVQETDMGNAEFKNTATATGEGTTGTDTTDPIPMDEVDKQLTVVKELTNLDEATGANGEEKAFALGDTMEFDITVTNTGNQTLSDIEVSDVMERAQIVAGKGYTVDGNKAIIKELKPEEKITVNAAYEVQEEDLGNLNFQNAATAEAGGTSGGGTSDPIPVEEKDPNLSVEKTVINPQEQYQVGDTASYEIVVANTGNVTLENVVVEDILQGTNGEVTFKEVDGVVIDGNVATIESMAPKTEVKLECSYEVTRADAGADLSNSVHVTSDTDETDPKQDTTPATDVEDIYNLTINYLYEDNSVAATSVHAQYLKGESFGYASPVIDGFTPNFAFVRTGADGMPAQDVTVNVIYTANAVPVVPIPNPGTDTPDTPTTGAPGGTGGAGQTGTPTAPTLAAQGTPEEPVGAEVGVNGDGELEIVPVIDEEVPLANRELDEHECCILHFLLMLAAMIVYAFYTRSMKKRQARIAELADQLETELLKRKQGTAE